MDPLRHFPSRDRIHLAVRKLDDHAKQVSAAISLPRNVVHRVFAFGFGPLHQTEPKACLFDLRWRNAVAVNVVDSVLRPDELVNSHGTILPPR